MIDKQDKEAKIGDKVGYSLTDSWRISIGEVIGFGGHERWRTIVILTKANRKIERTNYEFLILEGGNNG